MPELKLSKKLPHEELTKRLKAIRNSDKIQKREFLKPSTWLNGTRLKEN